MSGAVACGRTKRGCVMLDPHSSTLITGPLADDGGLSFFAFPCSAQMPLAGTVPVSSRASYNGGGR